MMKVVEWTWPQWGPEGNIWYENVLLFQLVKEKIKWNWMQNSEFKYYQLHVDSRNNRFVLCDRNGINRSPVDFFKQYCAHGDSDRGVFQLPENFIAIYEKCKTLLNVIENMETT